MHVKRSQKWGKSVRMTYAYPNFFANILLIRGVRMTSSEPSFEPFISTKRTKMKNQKSAKNAVFTAYLTLHDIKRTKHGISS